MTNLLECYRGSVNSWECDENDHLNVRFFMDKTMQTLHLGLVDFGLVSVGEQSKIEATIKLQHIRYLAEARTADPIKGLIGILEATPNRLKVLTDLRHGTSNKTLSTVVHELSLGTAKSDLGFIDQPKNAGSRGVPEKPSGYAGLSYEAAQKAGFRLIGRGVIQEPETHNGATVWHHYVGRLSDSIPNLWSYLSIDNKLGRVVMENRIEQYHSLALGDHFEIMSGVSELGDKVQTIVHLIFNARTKECVSLSTVASLAMDLSTRKATSLSEEEKKQMAALLLNTPDEADK